MVSKASEDLPDPLRPVITVSVLRGISTSIFFRLCWRAPCTVIRFSIGLVWKGLFPIVVRVVPVLQFVHNSSNAQVRVVRRFTHETCASYVLGAFQLPGRLSMPELS